jgi:hypothetical protein
VGGLVGGFEGSHADRTVDGDDGAHDGPSMVPRKV